MEFIFTSHGIEQFITRYDRSVSHKQARKLLNQAIEAGVSRLKERTHDGAEQWHIPSLGMIFITRPSNLGQVVVTTIPEHCSFEVRRQQQVDLSYLEKQRIQEDAQHALNVPLTLEDIPLLGTDRYRHFRYVLDVELDIFSIDKRHKFLTWFHSVLVNSVKNYESKLGKVIRVQLTRVR